MFLNLIFYLFCHILILPTFSESPDPCEFGVHTITISTSFPTTCSVIIGRFLINEDSNLSDSDLSSLFKDVIEVQGVLQVWNTDLEEVSFMKKIKVFSGDPLDKMISIVNNTKLKSISLSSLILSEGRVLIQKNPLLDLKPLCNTLHSVFFNRRFISQNLFDCGCELRQPLKEAKDFPENCIVLYGNVQITGSAPSRQQLYKLKTVQKLYGFVWIEQTNLETLGFLQGLREIEAGIEAANVIYIRLNKYLTRLDFIYLRSIKTRNPYGTLAIQGNYKLCLDPFFVQLAAQSEVFNVDINEASYCSDEYINNPSIYCRGALSSINDRCTKYIGVVLFINQPFFYFNPNFTYTKVPAKELKKLQQFEIIFGSIFIEGTSLTSFTLPNLQEIYQISAISVNAYSYYYNHAMVFQYNYLLEDVSFPSLHTAFKTVSFHEGNYNLTRDDDFCRRISNGTRRMVLGMNGNYDCRPYLVELTTLPMVMSTGEEGLG